MNPASKEGRKTIRVVLAEDQGMDIPRGGSKRHTDAHLLRSAHRAIRNHAIDTGSGNEQGKPTCSREQQHNESPVRHGVRYKHAHGGAQENRLTWIDRGDHVAVPG